MSAQKLTIALRVISLPGHLVTKRPSPICQKICRPRKSEKARSWRVSGFCCGKPPSRSGEIKIFPVTLHGTISSLVIRVPRPRSEVSVWNPDMEPSRKRATQMKMEEARKSGNKIQREPYTEQSSRERTNERTEGHLERTRTTTRQGDDRKEAQKEEYACNQTAKTIEPWK
ncbi:hypothetical protein DL93DRAFT_1892571 [Clavulina sp. PMI_390]|nr:hypothetical protein DL93DRAFT_1892571 [Clavulina sp. PMI_390]